MKKNSNFVKRPTVKFVVGMPVEGANVMASTQFDGYATTLLVHPRSTYQPLVGEAWVVEVDQKPISIDREKMTAVARAFLIRKVEPPRPVASAAPTGKLFLRDGRGQLVEVKAKTETAPEWIADLREAEVRHTEARQAVRSRYHRPHGQVYA